ncbi:MAG: hypothetical protein IKR73_08010, partial [Oscillospiraceae bacterium]|nr:hypothetical protein [Oscillospiraceae bacterium]
RTMQHFFVNGRYVKSLTCMSAIEEAYRNTIMEGKFPACVIFMDVPPEVVDVNVHPAKIEVRFSDEKLIYDAVYFAVKNAILNEKRTHEILPEHTPRPEDYAVSEYTDKGGVQTRMEGKTVSPAVRTFSEPVVAEKDVSAKRSEVASIRSQTPVHHDIRVEDIPSDLVPRKSEEPIEDRLAEAVMQAEQNWTAVSVPVREGPKDTVDDVVSGDDTADDTDISDHTGGAYNAPNDVDKLIPEAPKQYRFIKEGAFSHKTEETEQEVPKERWFRVIGEAFKSYGIAETEDSILIIDKHAAHERIRFERLRTGREELTAQMMLSPIRIRLDFDEYDALVKNLRVCADLGFVIEAQELPYVLIKGIPTMLDSQDAESMVTEMAHELALHRRDPLPEVLDEIYASMSCKGAIKAHDDTSPEEMADLFEQVLSDERIKYCPHGRPIMFELTKTDIEKHFKRIV